MKTCCKCGEIHPVEFFNKDRTRPDGLYPQCKACSRKAARINYRTHEGDHKAMKQQWKLDNADRHRAINRAYQLKHPEKNRATAARYRARLRQATPPWMDMELFNLIKDNCPPGWHVDHIHPLAGKNFCGLNAPWNLQFLPADRHYRKGPLPPAAAGGYSDV